MTDLRTSRLGRRLAGVTRRSLRRLGATARLALIGTTALVAVALAGAPALAPEDPWRMVAEIPIVRGPQTGIADMLARFLDLHHVALPPDQMFAIADSVALEGERHGLEPGLLLSVILSESRFQADAVSSKGAVGLMQLLPSTAAEVASEMEVEWAGAARLLDPQTNIAMGTWYLRKLIDAFGDDVHLALTAYNRGPNSVLRTLQEFDGRLEPPPGLEAPLESPPPSYADRILLNYARLRAEVPASSRRPAVGKRPDRLRTAQSS